MKGFSAEEIDVVKSMLRDKEEPSSVASGNHGYTNRSSPSLMVNDDRDGLSANMSATSSRRRERNDDVGDTSSSGHRKSKMTSESHNYSSTSSLSHHREREHSSSSTKYSKY